MPKPWSKRPRPDVRRQVMTGKRGPRDMVRNFPAARSRRLQRCSHIAVLPKQPAQKASKPQPCVSGWRTPVFIAKYAAAACAVFGPAMRLAQQREGDAVLLIKNFSIDPAVPEETRFEALMYRAALVKAHVIANLGSRLAGMEPAGAETSEGQVRSQ